MRTSKRNGQLVSAVQVSQDEEVALVSEQGRMVRTPVAEISVQGRATQGVRLIRLNAEEHLIGVAPLLEDKGEGEEADMEGSES